MTGADVPTAIDAPVANPIEEMPIAVVDPLKVTVPEVLVTALVLASKTPWLVADPLASPVKEIDPVVVDIVAFPDRLIP